MLIAYLNVTDGQTDRRTDGRTTYDSNTALALRASRGKNRNLITKKREVRVFVMGGAQA